MLQYITRDHKIILDGHQVGTSPQLTPGVSTLVPQRGAPHAIKLKRTAKDVMACKHLGPSLEPEKTGCQGCAKHVCTKRGITTKLYCIQECTACTHDDEPDPEPPKPRVVEVRRYDLQSLSPATGGQRLNPSIMPFQDGYLMSYRNTWENATVYVIKLNSLFEPQGYGVYLGLNHWEASAGREDARLFSYRGKPHVSFTGWLGYTQTRWNQANMLYARLNDDLAVEQIYYPQIPNRSSWEKNHVYFEHRGSLYLVYSVAPHIVMEVDGESIVQVYKTETPHQWKYGYLRGGAAPVLHRGHYYHFFHGVLQRKVGRLYTMGCAVFEAKPPFRIVRITNEPLDLADNKTNPGMESDVIFPGGAVYVHGRWAIAMGVHDSYSEIRFYNESDVERCLRSVGTGKTSLV